MTIITSSVANHFNLLTARSWRIVKESGPHRCHHELGPATDGNRSPGFRLMDISSQPVISAEVNIPPVGSLALSEHVFGANQVA